MNLKIGEVPLISIDRLFGGESTFRLGKWIKEYLKCYFWGLKQFIKKMINKNILLIGGSGNLGQKILSSHLFDKIFAPKKKIKFT